MSDSLTVYLSGDGYEGDAEAVVDVNGVQVSGVLDVSAANASDDVEAFTFTGNFGASPQVSVSMVNDVYGTVVPQQERNLYIDGYSYDGVEQLGYKVPQYYSQTTTNTLTSTLPDAERAADFVNSIGVDVHLGVPDSSYANQQTVAASLSYLGIAHIRVDLPTAQTLPEMEALAATGIKFDVLVPTSSSDVSLPGQLATLDPIAADVTSIEGPNEPNLTTSFSWDGQSGDAAEVAYQQAISNDVKANPALSGVAIYGLTLGGVGASAYQALGSLSPYETDGNTHIYFNTAPESEIQYNVGLAAITSPGLPAVITEMNYPTAPAIDGVTDAIQESFDLDALMDATKAGIAASYFYELLDENPDPDQTNIQNDFGLFNADGSPKPVATAIHDLATILADFGQNATSFQTGALSYTVTGLPASGDSLVLEKSDGAYDLVLWAEPVIWSAATGAQGAAQPRQVEVDLGTQAAIVEVFDPEVGSQPIATYTNASSVQLTVTDHPMIVEIGADSGSTTGTGGSGTSFPTLTVGSGPDVVALQVSENSYDGDAQFTVSIDGNQVGGTLTALADHAAGQEQTVDILGNFAPGQHVVSEDFLNDNGPRNLYVDSTTVNGTAVAGGSHSIYGDGSVSTDFVQAGSSASGSVQTVGSGSDVLALQMSEDAYLGDAQFTVTVDGSQVGGTLTVTALHDLGQSQTVDVLGDFPSGANTVSIDFLNDLDNPGVGDRNLYVGGATINGTTVANSGLNLYSDGSSSLAFINAAGTASPPTLSVGSGPVALALGVSENAYQGDAQFTVSIDGAQIGGVLTTTADHTAGQSQLVDVLGSLAPGDHSLTLDFLNDLYVDVVGGGDRNLYLDSAVGTYATFTTSSLNLYSNGPQTTDFTIAAHST